MVVTAYDPPHQWVVAKDGRLLQGVGTMRVEATAGGSRAIWMNELTPPFGILGRLAARLAGPVAALALQACLRRLARQLQSGALPLAASGSARMAGPGAGGGPAHRSTSTTTTASGACRCTATTRCSSDCAWRPSSPA
jgi:hypothetical protein